jgi:ATP-dependent Clp protease ATP-binding subunit ClpC
MFERFTDRARRVVVEAQEEARLLNHNYIGTEHLLLGLLREGQGVAAQALDALDVSLSAARERVTQIIGQGAQQSSRGGHIPFTPRVKKVLELSLREGLKLGDNYIGTEHILLGIVAEGEGVAAAVLTDLGAGAERVRRQVIRTKALYAIAGDPEGTPIQAPLPPGVSPGRGPRGQIAGLVVRIEVAEARLSALTAELVRLRELLARHGIESGATDPPPGSPADSDPGPDQGHAAGG